MTATILNTMASLKLHGMRATYQTMLERLAHHEMSNDELIATLIQSEWEYRENGKVHRYLRQARFRYGACLEEVDLDAKRGIDKNKLLRLGDGTFIRKRENLLITGPTAWGIAILPPRSPTKAVNSGSKPFTSKLRISSPDCSC